MPIRRSDGGEKKLDEQIKRRLADRESEIYKALTAEKKEEKKQEALSDALMPNVGKTAKEKIETEDTAERLFSKGLEAAKHRIDLALAKMSDIMYMPAVPPGMEGATPGEITAYKKGFHDTINGLSVHLYALYAGVIKLEDSATIGQTGHVSITPVELAAAKLAGFLDHKNQVADILLKFFGEHIHNKDVRELGEAWSKLSDEISNIERSKRTIRTIATDNDYGPIEK